MRAMATGGGINGMAILTAMVRKIEVIELRMTMITAPPRPALPPPTTSPQPGRDLVVAGRGDEERGALVATFGL